MELSFKDEDGLYTDEFMYWLLQRMTDLGIASLDYDKVQSMQEKLYQLPLFKDKEFDLINIVIAGFENLCWRRYSSGNIVVSVDSRESVDEIGAKLYRICKLINYGNLLVKGYPIYTNLFKQVKLSLPELYEEWLESE